MPDLIDALANLGPKGAYLRTGQVTATSPFKVTLFGPGEAVAMARLANYTPVLNDLVSVLVDSAGRGVVLGKVIAAESAGATTVTAYTY